MAVSNVEIRVNANNAVAQLNRLNGAAGTAAGTFGRLKSAAAGLGLGLIAKSAIQSAASFNDLQTRLKLVTSEYGEYEKAQKLVARAAKTFGLSNREAAEGVTDIFTRLRPLGIELADIESSFIGFNTVAKLSGVSAAGASAAFTQLAQALGSGRLQGDEFRSIAEQIPGLLGAVSLETGVAVGDLKEFASEGKLSTDIIIRALKRVESEGADKIAAIVKNSDVQRFKDFRDASDQLSISIGQRLLPAITPLLTGATELLKLFGKLPDPIQTGTIAVIGLAGAAAILGPSIATLNGLITTLAGASVLKAAITGLAVMGEKALAAAAGKTALANAITAANVKITASTVAVGLLSAAITAIPIALALVAFGNLAKRLTEAKTAQDRMTKAIKSGNVETIKAAIAVEEETISIERNKAAKMSLLNINGRLEASRKRLIKLRQALEGATNGDGDGDGNGNGNGNGNNLLDLDDKRKDMSQRMLDLKNQLRAAEESEQQRLAATLELMIRKQEIAESELGPIQKQNDLNQAHADFRKQILEIDKRIADQRDDEIEQAMKGFDAQMEHQEKLREQLNQQDQLYKQIGQTIENGLVQGITDAITGAKSLSESLSGILKSVGGMFLRQGISSLVGGIGGIFGGGGGGGFGVTPLTSGMNFFSAEGGFASGATNAVIGEAGPEYVIPENKMRESMARYVRGARGSAVIPENGEGGTNSEGGSINASTLDVRFNVERINSVDYVTASEFQAGIAQAAKRGAAEGERRAIGSMRNSPAVRRRVGV